MNGIDVIRKIAAESNVRVIEDELCPEGADLGNPDRARLIAMVNSQQEVINRYIQRFGDLGDPTRNTFDPDWPYELIPGIRALEEK